MTKQKYHDEKSIKKFIGKIEDEYNIFKQNMVSSSASEVYNNAYRICIYDELVSIFSDEKYCERLVQEELENILFVDNPLETLYQHWLSSGVTSNIGDDLYYACLGYCSAKFA